MRENMVFTASRVTPHWALHATSWFSLSFWSCRLGFTHIVALAAVLVVLTDIKASPCAGLWGRFWAGLQAFATGAKLTLFAGVSTGTAMLPVGVGIDA